MIDSLSHVLQVGIGLVRHGQDAGGVEAGQHLISDLPETAWEQCSVGRAPGGDPSYGRREWLRKRAFGVTTMRPEDAL